MTPRYNYFRLLLFFLIWQSCANDEQTGKTSTSTVGVGVPAYTLVSKAGDTIRTGEPITVDIKAPDPDSLRPPVTFPLRGTPRVYPAEPQHPQPIDPRVTILPENLPTNEPGVGEFAPLTTQPIQGEILPFRFLPPTEVGPFRFNDDAKSNIKYLDVDQGMTSSFVNAVLEDSRGHLWIGTSGGGISRFDGKNLSVVNTQAFGIFSLTPELEDSRGNIWFRANSNGAICYDGARFIKFEQAAGLNIKGVSPILEDGQGKIWLGTDQGAYRLALDTTGIAGNLTTYSQEQGLGLTRVMEMTEDSKGNIWFVGAGRVSRWDGRRFTIITQQEGLPDTYVYSILEDQDQHIWLGTGTGLLRLNGRSLTHFTEEEGLAGPNVTDIHEDEKGRIWATSSNGVSVYDGIQFNTYAVKNSGYPIQFASVIEDSYGNFWFGNQGRGLIYLQLKNNFESFQNIAGRDFTITKGIVQDELRDFWFNTYGEGLFKFNGGEFINYSKEQGLLSDYVQKILIDHRRDMWLGTLSGLSRFTPDRENSTGVFTNYTKSTGLNSDAVNDLVEGDDQDIWIGTAAGLARYSDNHIVDYTASQSLPEIYVSCIFKRASGVIWLGTRKGAIKVELGADRSQASLTFYTPREGLGLSSVRDILEDSNGNLWFAGHEGVHFFNGTTFLKVPLKDGWWNHSYRNMGHYNSLMLDSLNRIWISREKELSVIAPKVEEGRDLTHLDSTAFVQAFQIFNFGKDHGISTFEMYAGSVLLDDQNRIWWGGGPHCVRLDLNDFKLPEAPPKVDLNHIEIRQQFVDFRALSDSAYRDTVAFGRQIRASYDSVVPFRNYPTTLDLPHDLDHLTFHFSGIDWADPSAIRYRFKLDEEDNWSQPQASPRADFRNLPPGKHQLEVQAIGMAQVWSEPFTYAFNIRPPWWQTGWAYGFWILLAGGLVYALYRYQLKRQLALAENERLLELDQVKSRLFTNITHEFRTPLTIILGMIDQIRHQPEVWLREGSEMIRRNGRQVLHLVNQMLDLARIETATLHKRMVQANVVGYLKYLTESFQSLATARQQQLHFSTATETLEMDFDPDHLLQIVTNLLSNALKFTPANGEVRFRVEPEAVNKQGYLKIIVSDTGPGIPPEQLSKVFDRFFQADTSGGRKYGGTGIGLALTKELIEMHGGSIDVTSSPGKGAEFTVRLPINNTAPQIDILESEFVDTHSIELMTSELQAGLRPAPVDDAPLMKAGDQLLIVEDNADVVRYLRTCLRDHYQLLVARNGEEGVKMAIDAVPDIIISDVMMPGKNGFELCQELKENEKTTHIPIILLTARGDLESKIYGLSRGADVYLPKPFYQKELLAHLDNLITQRQHLQRYYQRILTGMDPGEPTAVKDPFLTKVLELVEENLDRSELEIQELADLFHVSRIQFYRKIKALTGRSPSRFVRSYRLGRARQLLLNTDLTVAEIAYRTGFSDPAYFSKMFKEEFDLTPSDVRKQ